MKKILCITLLLLTFLSFNTAEAAIQFVQAQSVKCNSVAVCNKSGFSTTAGNALFVYIGSTGNQSTSTVVDSQGNVYATTTFKNSGTTQMGQWFYALNTVGGTESVTSTFSASQTQSLIFLEFSGIASSNVLDATSTNTATATSTTTGTAATSTNANDLVLGGFSRNTGSGTFIPSGDFTTAQNSSTTGEAMVEWRIVSQTGKYVATSTTSNSVLYVASLAEFKMASASTATTNPVIRAVGAVIKSVGAYIKIL